MKLIIGLGNPGPKYQWTRHNLGFWVVDRIAQRIGISLSEPICAALVGRGSFGTEQVLLAKPQSFMNRSGGSVQALLQEFHAGSADMIVIYDDLDLPMGRIRIRARGRAGGHRGIQSILESVAGAPFPRVRIGIGRPRDAVDAATFVLEPLSADAVRDFDEVVARGADAIAAIVSDGMQRAMEQFNRASLDSDTTL